MERNVERNVERNEALISFRNEERNGVPSFWVELELELERPIYRNDSYSGNY